MKKVLQFLRSMRFGLILLGLIAALSVAGTAIPQGRELAWYPGNYPRLHGVILRLKLYDIFHTWYFQALLILLAVNLILCSLVRVKRLAGSEARLREGILSRPEDFPLTPAQQERVKAGLEGARCRAEPVTAPDGSPAVLYRKNLFGRYGSFVTHLSILLTLIFGAAALYLPTVTDHTCLPGEALTMSDGTRIAVESFRIEDDTGRLDFTSALSVTLPDGRESGAREISVNHPLSFGPWKVYQQTYGTAGSITVRNLETELSDTFTLTDLTFLSLDGMDGLWYEAVYPDMIEDPSGGVTLVTNTSGSYPNPVYAVQTASAGVYTPVLAFPGDELQVNELAFTFNAPVEYPGLRVKYTPPAVNALLIAAFALMIVGFGLTFFCQPVLARLDGAGIAVGGPKPEGARLSVQGWMEESSREEKP